MAERNGRISRKAVIEAAAWLVLIVLAFAAIAASDVSVQGTHKYWLGLVGLCFAATLVGDRLHTDHSLTDSRSAVAIVLHWLGVLAAVQLVYFFVSAGRIANADTGLTNGMVLALGLFTAGAHGNWRLIVVGTALAAATAAVAFMEEYMWVMFGLALLSVVVMVLGGLMFGRRGKTAGADI